MQRQVSVRFEYLAFSAALATLPVYEPALHTFHTLAPGTFDVGSGMFVGFGLLVLLALAAGMFVRPSLARRLDGRRATAVGASCIAAGTVGLVVMSVTPVPGPAVAMLGMAGGAGSGWLLLAWGRAFSRCERREALSYLALDSALGALLMNTIGTLPLAVGALLAFVFDVLAVVAVVRLLRENGENPAGRSQAPAGSVRPVLAKSAPALVGMALFGASFQVLGGHGVLYFYLSFLVGTIVAGLAVLVVLLVAAGRPVVSLLYDAVLPAAGFLAIAVALLVPGASRGFILADALMVFLSFAAPLLLASVVSFAGSGECDRDRLLALAVAAFAGASLLGLACSAAFGPDVPARVFAALVVAYLAWCALGPVAASAFGRGAQPASPAGDACPIEDLAERTGLTAREAEVLGMLAAGRPSSYIAKELYISESTARGHIHRIYQKFGVSTRDDLMEALALGGVEPPFCAQVRE